MAHRTSFVGTHVKLHGFVDVNIQSGCWEYLEVGKFLKCGDIYSPLPKPPAWHLQTMAATTTLSPLLSPLLQPYIKVTHFKVLKFVNTLRSASAVAPSSPIPVQW